MSRRLALALLVVLSTLAAWTAPAFAANQTVTATSGNTFSPARVGLFTNETVTWNNGGGIHNVRFDDGSFTQPPAPSSSPWSVMRTFLTPAELRYYCEVHGGPGGVGMSGTVVVFPSYPRPQAGSPVRVPLVPAFVQCTVPNSTHGGPLPRLSPARTRSRSRARYARHQHRHRSRGSATRGRSSAPAPRRPVAGEIGTAPDVRLFGNGSDVRLPSRAPAAACPGGAGFRLRPEPGRRPLHDRHRRRGRTPTPPRRRRSATRPAGNPPCADGADMTALAEIPGSTSSAGKAIRVTDTFNDDPLGR